MLSSETAQLLGKLLDLQHTQMTVKISPEDALIQSTEMWTKVFQAKASYYSELKSDWFAACLKSALALASEVERHTLNCSKARKLTSKEGIVDVLTSAVVIGQEDPRGQHLSLINSKIRQQYKALEQILKNSAQRLTRYEAIIDWMLLLSCTPNELVKVDVSVAQMSVDRAKKSLDQTRVHSITGSGSFWQQCEASLLYADIVHVILESKMVENIIKRNFSGQTKVKFATAEAFLRIIYGQIIPMHRAKWKLLTSGKFSQLGLQECLQLSSDITSSAAWKKEAAISRALEMACGSSSPFECQEKALRLMEGCANVRPVTSRVEVLNNLADMFNCVDRGDIDRLASVVSSSSSLLSHFEPCLQSVQSLVQALSLGSEDNWQTLAVLAKGHELIAFLKKATRQKADFRYLVDSLEDELYGDHSLEQSTVASLVSVHNSLKEVLRENASLSCITLVQKITTALGKVADVVEKLQECMGSLVDIQAVHRQVGDPTVRTRAMVRSATNGGRFQVEFKSGKYVQSVMYVDREGRKVVTPQQLHELRSRCLLLSAGVNVDVTDDRKIKVKETMLAFALLVEKSETFAQLADDLCSHGHFDFQMLSPIQFPPMSTTDLTTSHENLDHGISFYRGKLTEWHELLASTRLSHFYLNFFWGSQLWDLLHLATGLSTATKRQQRHAYHLLRYVDPHCTAAPSQARKIDSSSHSEQLKAVGEMLEVAFGSVKAGRYKTMQFRGVHSNRVNGVESGRFHVTLINSHRQSTLPTLLRLYYDTSCSFPEAWQVLFCEAGTLLPEVALFLDRCLAVFARGGHWAQRLFCIVEPERLSDLVRLEVIEKVNCMVRASEKLDQKFLLAMICRSDAPAANPIAANFTAFTQTNATPFADQAVRTLFRSACKEAEVVTSECPGLGKTETIRIDAMRATVPLAIKTLSIGGKLSRSDIVQKLESLDLTDQHALHLNVGYVDNTDLLDTLLFQMVVLGCIVAGNRVYCLPTQAVFIEIANTINDSLANSLCMVKWLHRKHLTWHIARYIVSNDPLSPVQVVCQYLKMSEELAKKNVILKKGPNGKVLHGSDCRRLLDAFLSTYLPKTQLSFSLVKALLSVWADQLIKLSSCQAFRVRQLEGMVRRDQAGRIRTLMFETLRDMACRFATRSISACRTSQHIALSQASGKSLKQSMLERVGGMIRWDDSNHLVIAFDCHIAQTFTMLYRDRDKLDKDLEDLMKPQGPLLQSRPDDPLPSLQSLDQSELRTLAARLTSTNLQPVDQFSESDEYAYTTDNLLKMALIIQRVQAHIPVVIMGETGCGKTSLIRHLAHIHGADFLAYNIHAGRTEEDILNFTQESQERALKNKRQSVWLFYDEINTCDHLHLLTDIICRRQLNGVRLAPNLVFIAACNPYRESKSKVAGAGLSAEVLAFSSSPVLETQASNTSFSGLVYLVHPLPETMLDYVWDYGTLAAVDEQKYIQHMCQMKLKGIKSQAGAPGVNMDLMVQLLICSQKFVRANEAVSWAVSLRDVDRCLQLVVWWVANLPKIDSTRGIRPLPVPVQTLGLFVRAALLSLCLCYYSRLVTSEARDKYLRQAATVLNRFSGCGHSVGGTTAEKIEALLHDQQADLVERMSEKPPDTALNTALLENVFVALISILNRIPVMIVGKPGSSKSLSVVLLQNNLRGPSSQDAYYQTLPEIYIYAYQGSTSSTSEGIEAMFKKAEYLQNEEDVMPVVLLDEVGLAEKSPANPLKVLHNLLEPDTGARPKIGVIGISNWSLDPAKMNRAIHLARPDPTYKDMYATAKAIRDARKKRAEAELEAASFPSDSVLQVLSQAFMDYLEHQKKSGNRNFHGLRDFYYLVKSLCAGFSDTKQLPAAPAGAPCVTRSLEMSDIPAVVKSFRRNFGGLLERTMEDLFFGKLPEKCRAAQWKVSPPVQELVEENICDRESRHLMLVTEGDSAMDLLREMLRKNEILPCLIYGSQLEGDQHDDYNYRVLRDIILCMERGGVLVLRDLDRIYSSLYDMLNQNYVKVGNQMFCRVALGRHSNPRCPIHNSFRCIVIVDEAHLDTLDPPFLNRFEKQRLGYGNAMQPESFDLENELREWVESFSHILGYEGQFDEKDAFCGFSPRLLRSLVVDASRSLEQCKKELLWLAPPESFTRSFGSKLAKTSAKSEFAWLSRVYNEQCHDGLLSLFESLTASCVRDCNGVKAVVVTCASPLKFPPQPMRHVVGHMLGEFQTENRLVSAVSDYLQDSTTRLFVLQCSMQTDRANLLLAQNTMERLWNKEKGKRTQLKSLCIVVHLRREEFEDADDAPMNDSFPFSFQSDWKLVALNSLEEPPIKNILDMSLEGLVWPTVTEVVRREVHSAWRLQSSPQSVAPRKAWPSINAVGDSAEQANNLAQVALRVLERREAILQHTSSDVDGSISSSLSKLDKSSSAPRPWKFQIACSRHHLFLSSSFSDALQAGAEQKFTAVLQQILALIITHNALEALLDSCTSKMAWPLLTELGMEIKPSTVSSNASTAASHCQFKFPFSNLFFKRVAADRPTLMQKVQALKKDFDSSGGDMEHGSHILTLSEVFSIAEKLRPHFSSYVLELRKNQTARRLTPLFVHDFIELETSLISPGVQKEARHQVACAMLESHVRVRDLARMDLAQTMAYLWVAFEEIKPKLSTSLQLLVENKTRKRLVQEGSLMKALRSAEELIRGNPDDKKPAWPQLPDEEDTKPTRSSSGSQLLSRMCKDFLLELQTASDIEQWQQRVDALLMHSASTAGTMNMPLELHVLRMCSSVLVNVGHGPETVTKTRKLAESGLIEHDGDDDSICLSINHASAAIQSLIKEGIKSKSTSSDQLFVSFFSHVINMAGDHLTGRILESILSQMIRCDVSTELLGPLFARLLGHLDENLYMLVDSGFQQSVVEGDPALSPLDQCLIEASPTVQAQLLAVCTDQLRNQEFMSDIVSCLIYDETPDEESCAGAKKTFGEALAAVTRSSPGSPASLRLAVACAVVKEIVSALANWMREEDRQRESFMEHFSQITRLLNLKTKSQTPRSQKLEEVPWQTLEFFKVLCHYREFTGLSSLQGLRGDFPSVKILQEALDDCSRIACFPFCVAPGFEEVFHLYDEYTESRSLTKILHRLSSREEHTASTTRLALFLFVAESMLTAGHSDEQELKTIVQITKGLVRSEASPVIFRKALQRLVGLPKFRGNFLSTTNSDNRLLQSVVLHLLGMLVSTGKELPSRHLTQWVRLLRSPLSVTSEYLIGGGDVAVVNNGLTFDGLTCRSCSAVFSVESLDDQTTSDVCCPNDDCRSTNVRFVTKTKGEEEVDDSSFKPGCACTSRMEQNTAMTCRGLSVLEFNILNFLQHAALVSALSLCSDGEHLYELCQLLQCKDEAEAEEHVLRQLRKRFAVLKDLTNGSWEDVSFFMHAILLQLGNKLTNCPQENLCKTNAQRCAEEMRLIRSLRPELENPLGLSRDCRRKLSEVQLEWAYDEKQQCNMRLLCSIHELPRDSRSCTQARFSQKLSIDVFRRTLAKEVFRLPDEERSKYPVVVTFLKMYDELRLVSHLRPLLAWSDHLSNKLSGKMSRTEVQTAQMGDFITPERPGGSTKEEKEAPQLNDELRRSESLFSAFMTAWTEVFSGDHCLLDDVLPSRAAPIMSQAARLSSCVIDHQESPHLYDVIERLTHFQNLFLARILDLAAQPSSSSLRFLASSGTARLNNVHVQDAPAKSFIDFDEVSIEKLQEFYCQALPRPGEGGEFWFYFAGLETELTHRLVVGKTFLSLDKASLRSFKYFGELHYPPEEHVKIVAQTMVQEDLPPSTKDFVKQSLDRDKSVARRLLQQIHLALRMLAADDSPADGQIHLAEYLEKLGVDQTGLLTDRALSHDSDSAIKLKHTVALYELVEMSDEVIGLAMDMVPNCYRKKLSQPLGEELRRLCPRDVPRCRLVLRRLHQLVVHHLAPLYSKPSEKELTERAKQPLLRYLSLDETTASDVVSEITDKVFGKALLAHTACIVELLTLSMQVRKLGWQQSLKMLTTVKLKIFVRYLFSYF